MHSFNCNFISAFDNKPPVFYYVERLNDRGNFVIRSVRVKQHNKCSAVATIGFMKAPNGDRSVLKYCTPLPTGLDPPIERLDDFAIFRTQQAGAVESQ